MFRHNFFFFFLAFQLFSFGSTIISFPFPPRCYGSFPLSAIVVSAFNIFPAIEFLHCFVRVGENEIIFIVRVDRLIRLLCTEAIIEMLERRPVTPLALLILLYLFLPFWIGGKNKTLFRSSFPFFFNFPSLRSTILLYHTFFVTLSKERKVSKECLNLSTKKKKNIYIRIISRIFDFNRTREEINTRNNSSWNKF